MALPIMTLTWNRSIAMAIATLLFSGLALAEVGPDGRKYHPGHYIAMNMWDDRSVVPTVLRDGVAGVQVRYTWIDLEPAKDQYDFSAIRSDLEVLEGTGRQLVAFIFDKSFKDEKYTPPYLWDGYTLPSNAASGGVGFVSKRWDPYVVDRFTRLVEAIGREFDDHPRFEGVAIQETAIGIADSVLDAEGYTPEQYRDALVEQLCNASAALPKSRVFWYMNFLVRKQAYIADVRDQVLPCEVAVGGPDILPGQYSLERHVYPVIKSTYGGIRFNSAQYDSFRHERTLADGRVEYWSPLELFEFARDELELRYIFWNRMAKPSPADSFTIDDAYPVMAEHPDFSGVPRPPLMLPTS